MNSSRAKTYYIPFILTVIVLCFDQLSKYIILATIEPWTVGYDFFNCLIRIICVYNTGAAFSLGHTLPNIGRVLFLSIFPLTLMISISVVYFKASLSRLQRWALCGIIGGGCGNLIDRFFRQEGVVDFIDVKFFGIFGLERWPTFNIADAAIVICGFILFFTAIRNKPEKPKDNNFSAQN